MNETLWEGEPTEFSVDPASMTLTAWNRERLKELRERHMKEEGYGFSDEEWASCKIAEIEKFMGNVEILTEDGKELAFFSGSDEYGGHVNGVWKITTRLQKEGYPDKIWQLWTKDMSEYGVYVVQVHDEDAVVLKTPEGVYEIYNGPAFSDFGSSDVAEVVGNALKTKPITIDATEIAERTPDEWTWPDVERTAIEDLGNEV